MFFVFLTRM